MASSHLWVHSSPLQALYCTVLIVIAMQKLRGTEDVSAAMRELENEHAAQTEKHQASSSGISYQVYKTIK